MRLIFDWDDKKNKQNIKKHGIAFEDAALIFSSSLSRMEPDYEHGEERYAMFGYLDDVAIMVIFDMQELDDGCALVRIISARKLTNNERCRYENDV